MTAGTICLIRAVLVVRPCEPWSRAERGSSAPTSSTAWWLADEVVVIDNLSSGDLSFIQGHLDSGAVVLVEGDICNPDDVGRAMAMNIDCVFHLAANPDIRLGTRITDTDLKQGTVATYNIVKPCA